MSTSNPGGRGEGGIILAVFYGIIHVHKQPRGEGGGGHNIGSILWYSPCPQATQGGGGEGGITLAVFYGAFTFV